MQHPRPHYARLALSLLFAALTAASCTSLRHSSSERRTSPSPTEQSHTESARENTVVKFSAIVNGISVSGQIRVSEDSLLWVSVNKIVELGRAMASADSVWLNVPMAERYFAGTYADLRKYTSFPLSFQTLQNIALNDEDGSATTRIAQSLGLNAEIYILSREKTGSLSFPFKKKQ